MTDMKAYEVTLRGFDEGGIYFGATASKARYKAFLSASEAFPGVKIMDLSVRRARRFDIAPAADGKAIDYAERALQEAQS